MDFIRYTVWTGNPLKLIVGLNGTSYFKVRMKMIKDQGNSIINTFSFNFLRLGRFIAKKTSLSMRFSIKLSGHRIFFKLKKEATDVLKLKRSDKLASLRLYWMQCLSSDFTFCWLHNRSVLKCWSGRAKNISWGPKNRTEFFWVFPTTFRVVARRLKMWKFEP